MSQPAYLTSIRSSYDTAAASYSALHHGDFAGQPAERSLLTLFSELASGRASGRVADVGCGPGHVTAFLSQQGLDVFGVDLSPAMVEQARANYPALSFETGSMTALDQPDGSLSGLSAWFSIIHIPDEDLPGVLAGFHRVLTPGAPLMLAFQLGDGPQHFAQVWGHAVDLVIHRRQPAAVTQMLAGAGFHVRVTTVFEPEGRPGRQAVCLIARKND
jgi:ubiquinone/menaquinone biosynthesis C-methylase UbiE